MDSKLSYSAAKFAFTFCNELDKNRTSVCSPLSVETLLAITALGCKGQAQAELLRACNIPNEETLRSSFGRLTTTFQSVKGVTIKMANKVFLKKDNTIKTGIKKDAKKIFKLNVKQIDYGQKQKAAQIVNKWVTKKTNGLITEIISEEQFTDKSELVLINVTYFRGQWKVPFSIAETEGRNFHVNKSTEIQVPMMYKQESCFKYGINTKLNARLLQMDYKGGEASMVIVLPDDIEGLSSVIQKVVNGHDLMADIETLKNTELNIMIPKFKVTMTLDLKHVLSKMGIKYIFDELQPMIDMLKSPNEKLFVSDAVQKTYIVVDETGTEAAAVTSVTLRRQCCGKMAAHESFFADRPFLYLIIVRRIPLFIGIYEGSQFGRQK